jgi:non-specific protein-tyrosine kinase
MTIQEFLAALRRYWVTSLVCALAGVIAAIGLTAVLPKVYVATTIQFVRGVPGAGSSAEYQAAQFAVSRAKSYSVMIGNPDVLSGIANDLDLVMDPGELYSRLSVDNPIDTALINVTARGRTADEAQSISVAAADNLAKLIIRLESAGVASGKSPVDVQTAVPALKPSSPSSPRASLNIAVGLLLGAAFGSLLAVVRDGRERARTRRASGRNAKELAPAPGSARAQ